MILPTFGAQETLNSLLALKGGSRSESQGLGFRVIFSIVIIQP